MLTVTSPYRSCCEPFIDGRSGAAGQGIAAGEFAKVLRAIRVGAAYANIHTQQRPGGEVRGQIHSHENSD